MSGQTLLLLGEQGLGDVIQFARYAPLVKARSSARVLLRCHPLLYPLLQTLSGVDELVRTSPGQTRFDRYVPLLSLPGVFATRVDAVPADVPYLAAEPPRVERWRARLDPAARLRVGIAWQGDPKYAGDFDRSVPLEQFAPLAACPGVKLYSLQKYDGVEQLAALRGRFAVEDLGPEMDSAGAFLDTAAVMQSLDLVVTTDTAIAHLAGALAVPAWVALQYAPDWRWLLDRHDSPWYPTLRLFRQSACGDWAGVFARMAAELPSVTARRSPPMG